MLLRQLNDRKDRPELLNDSQIASARIAAENEQAEQSRIAVGAALACLLASGDLGATKNDRFGRSELQPKK